MQITDQQIAAAMLDLTSAMKENVARWSGKTGEEELDMGMLALVYSDFSSQLRTLDNLKKAGEFTIKYHEDMSRMDTAPREHLWYALRNAGVDMENT
jgi:hypothetical protein